MPPPRRISIERPGRPRNVSTRRSTSSDEPRTSAFYLQLLRRVAGRPLPAHFGAAQPPLPAVRPGAAIPPLLRAAGERAGRRLPGGGGPDRALARPGRHHGRLRGGPAPDRPLRL